MILNNFLLSSKALLHKPLGRFLFAVSILFGVGTSPLTAQSDWIYNPTNGHYYKEFIVPGHNWHNAVAEAENLGGYLACISDATENDWLLLNFPPRGGQQEAFLGGTDEVTEGVWEWISGEPWSYDNWSPGEPNNRFDEEHYLEWATTWNDVPDVGYPFGSGTPYGIVESDSLFGNPHTIYGGAADGPKSVISADIDNDGDLDVVYGTHQGKDLFWNENLGSGAFGQEQIIGTDVGSIVYVRMADLDGDGLKDLIYTCWAGGAGVQWMKHLGGGSFGPAQAIDAQMAAEKIDTADLDGDGDIDIAIAIGRFESEGGAFKWYENNGSGGFTIHILAQSAYPKGAHCADMNGDGNIDILVAGWTRNDISWFENMGSGSFVKHAISTPYEAYDVLAIDADGDGDADIVYSNNGNGTSGSVYSIENLGNGSFGPETLISSRPTGAARLETADVDLDGDLDLFWVSGNVDEVTWHENLGGMTFGPEQNIDSQLGGGSGLCAADVDGDGDKDLLLAVNGSGSNISWYENRSTAPSGSDSDNDGLLDADEILVSTDPFDFDTDNDGLGDGQEMGVVNGTPYTNMAIFVPDADPTTTTDPLNADTDGGGVADGIEDQNRDGALNSWETDPVNTADEALAFYVSDLSPGQKIHFEVFNAGSGSVLAPALSTAGAGPTSLGIGVTVDLSVPIIPLIPILSDSQGRGSWDGPRVPTSVSMGRQIWLQLVEIPIGAAGHRVSNPILLPVGLN